MLRYAAAALACGLSVSAAAAELPAPAPWAGFHLGGHVGYGYGTVPYGLPGLPAFTINRNFIRPIIFGAAAGYRWQSGHVVYGVRSDVIAGSVGDEVTCSFPLVPSIRCRNHPYWMAAIRGEFGHAIGSALVTFNGGLAYGRHQNSSRTFAFGPVIVPGAQTMGFVAGAGLEHAITSNWSARLDYSAWLMNGHGTGPSDIRVKRPYTFHSFTVGLSYRFGS